MSIDQPERNQPEGDRPGMRLPWRRKREAEQGQEATGNQSQVPPKPLLTPQAKALVDAFSAQPDVSTERAERLQSVINSSPTLAGQINRAVASGDLQSFAVQPKEVNAGGTYNGAQRQINMPLTMLDQPSETAFILGHEVQHAINRPVTDQALQQFPVEVHQQAQKGSRDYTQQIAHVMGVQRWDEASANLAGWNAFVDHVKSKDPNASLADIAAQHPGRSADVVMQAPDGSVTPRPNLALKPDHTAELNQFNVEGMAQNYVDKPGYQSRLGHHGNSDYANYYGAGAVGSVVNFQRQMFPPQPGQQEQPIELNLGKLGVSRDQMEQNGIHLGQHQHPMPYLDTTSFPPTQAQLHHTYQTHQHIPSQQAQQPSEPERATQQQAPGTQQPAVRQTAPQQTSPQQTTSQQTTTQQSNRQQVAQPKPTRAAQTAQVPNLGERASQALQLATVSQGRPAAEATRGNAISLPRGQQPSGPSTDRSRAAGVSTRSAPAEGRTA